MMRKKIDRRNFLKTVGKAVVVTAATGTLAGCGEPNPPNKDEILADILNRDDTYTTYEIEVTSCNIIERNTDKSNMTDDVCFQVTGETTLFSYEATYNITYIMQEKSWVVGSFDCPENQFVPLYFPTENDALKLIERENRECVSLGQTDGDGWKEFVYSFRCIDQTYPSLSLVSQIDVQFKFVPNRDNIWQTKIKNDENIGYQFHLAGNWNYQDEECDIHINVGESPVTIFYEDTPTLTLNSYNVWFRRKTEWFSNEMEEKSYEGNQTKEISGTVYLPSFNWEYGDRSRTVDLNWKFELEGERIIIEYSSKQKDFVITYDITRGGYNTLERENG